MEARGEQVLRSHLSQVQQYPSGYAQFLIALDYALGPKTEIRITSYNVCYTKLLRALAEQIWDNTCRFFRLPIRLESVG